MPKFFTQIINRAHVVTRRRKLCPNFHFLEWNLTIFVILNSKWMQIRSNDNLVNLRDFENRIILRAHLLLHEDCGKSALIGFLIYFFFNSCMKSRSNDNFFEITVFSSNFLYFAFHIVANALYDNMMWKSRNFHIDYQ